MTRDEILNMPAGREMDALIAEKIMGWTYKETYRTMTWELPHKKVTALFSPEGREKTPPKFSTDIAAAWDVADKINRMIAENILEVNNDYNYLTLECVGYTSGYAASFDCIFENEWFEDITNYKYASRAETAQLAICRAALLAVMEAE